MLLNVYRLSVLTANIKPVPLLQDINFNISGGTISTITGKNGTGKSTLIKALTRLLDSSDFKVTGEVLYNGKDLLDINQHELRQIRKEKIKYVFQDAVNSFDPLKKTGYYFKLINADPDKTNELLQYFLLPQRDKLFSLYPYELSGGMAQRILIILALLSSPDFLILDEPTSALDSPIVNLLLYKLKEFVSSGERSILLVTQDLTFAKELSTRLTILNNHTLSPFYDNETFFSPDNTETENLVNCYKEIIV